MNLAVLCALQEMVEASCGCAFERDSEAVRDGGEECVVLGYATGPHGSAWGSAYYEITERGRAAYRAATQPRRAA